MITILSEAVALIAELCNTSASPPEVSISRVPLLRVPSEKMEQTKILLFLAALVSFVTQYAEGAALFNRLMGKMFATVSMCTDDLQGKLSPELCLSQFDGENNPNDSQFDGCKQAMTCAVKKLNYMTEEGRWNQEKLASLKDGIKDQEAINEFDQTFQSCSSVPGTDGDAVINMISCIINNSDRAKQSYNELKETFMNGY
ncbi:uncharacterized protein LOC128985208 [Macrosteles quadrilineatus]|uniref:uncharacterized protein LOC128985208 n=1 Tax=Macrosteles quadrilineatus TaxID=74068 RepID=UPI0023E12731|nr:uncharacterized protein LOC128985208 [Macrosteles quadrilineatus]